jgi:hypothetical protein
MDLYFWKWSISEPYYKSARRELKVEKEQEKEQKPEVSEYDTQLNAINQSLSDDLDTSNNKREELDNRAADRELVQQRGANPFLTQQSSYVNDIVVRDMFLKPINTTQGRTKNKDDTQES